MRWVIYILFFIILSICVNAQDVTLSTNQSEYYFKVGEKAIVPLKMNNEYKETIEGMLTISTTTKVQKKGTSYQSSRTNSQSYRIPPGERKISLGMGKSQTPKKMVLDISYEYTSPEMEEKESKLPEIKVHFVSKESQKKNKKDVQKSETKSKSDSSKQKNDLNKAQKKLQDNRRSQNTQNIKEQMEEQMKEKNQFSKNLESQEKFKEMHKQMKKEGYDVQNKNMNPENSKTGNFSINYKDNNSNEAQISGRMENNTIKEINNWSSKEILNKLEQNSKYKELNESLEEQGYKRTNSSATRTQAEVNYKNDQNQSATIKAEVKNKTIKDIELKKENDFPWISLMVIIIILATTILFLFLRPKKEHQEINQEENKTTDYKKEAKNILEKAESLFNKKEYKEAYAKVSEAVRFFYIHNLNLNKELTNTEVLKELKRKKIKTSNIQKLLNICGLVEFAKYKPNKKDFTTIYKIAKKIIK